VVELDDGHGDEGDRKRKQNPMEIMAKVLLGFWFW
jgi:hypothetical protein